MPRSVRQRVPIVPLTRPVRIIPSLLHPIEISAIEEFNLAIRRTNETK
jgi:hypothetical protein